MDTRLFGISFIIGYKDLFVSGVLISLSRNGFYVSPNDTKGGIFAINCIGHISYGYRNMTQISIIKKNASDGNYEQTLALMTSGGQPTLQPSTTWFKRGAVVQGEFLQAGLDLANLTLSLDVSQLLCKDSGPYECELKYNSSGWNSFIEGSTDILHVNVMEEPDSPIVMSAYNLSNDGSAIHIGFHENYPAIFIEGHMLRLICAGRIGNDPKAKIVWQKSGSEPYKLLPYNPELYMKDDGAPAPVDMCQYRRRAWVQYITTSADVARSSNHTLVFECRVNGVYYKTPRESRPKFYIRVLPTNSAQSSTAAKRSTSTTQIRPINRYLTEYPKTSTEASSSGGWILHPWSQFLAGLTLSLLIC